MDMTSNEKSVCLLLQNVEIEDEVWIGRQERDRSAIPPSIKG